MGSRTCPVADRVWGTGVLFPGGPRLASTKAMLIGGSRSSSPLNERRRQHGRSGTRNRGGGWQSGRDAGRRARSRQHRALPDGPWSSRRRGGIDEPVTNGRLTIRRGRSSSGTDGSDWTLGPPQAEKRAYHSTALLLPDGRVVSAGDDVNGPTARYNTDSAEIYSPPYLFKGAASCNRRRRPTARGVGTPSASAPRAGCRAPPSLRWGQRRTQTT